VPDTAVIALIIEFTVRPGCRSAFMAKLRADAAQTLRDDGCLRMEVIEVPDDPDCIVLSELWRDQAAIEAHKAKPGHSHAWQEPLIAHKRVVKGRLCG
jgi:quinol monooxygenase YgiN